MDAHANTGQMPCFVVKPEELGGGSNCIHFTSTTI